MHQIRVDRIFTLKCSNYVLARCAKFFLKAVQQSVKLVTLSTCYVNLVKHFTNKDFRVCWNFNACHFSDCRCWLTYDFRV